MIGYIYILSQANGRSVKVGKTMVSPDERLKGYAKAYQLKGFSLHTAYPVPEEALSDIEYRAHINLKKFQISGLEGAREIFACSATEAEEAIKKAVSQSIIHKKATEERRRKEEEEIKRQKAKDDAWKNSSQFKSFQNIERELVNVQTQKEDIAKKLEELGSEKDDIPVGAILFWTWPMILLIIMTILYNLSIDISKNSIGVYAPFLLTAWICYFLWKRSSGAKRGPLEKELKKLQTNINDKEKSMEKLKADFFSD